MLLTATVVLFVGWSPGFIHRLTSPFQVPFHDAIISCSFPGVMHIAQFFCWMESGMGVYASVVVAAATVAFSDFGSSAFFSSLLQARRNKAVQIVMVVLFI